MSPRYMEALSEVDYIINNLENEEVEKIPSKFREFVRNNKSRTYEVNGVENLREETYAILAFIYRKFLAPIEEREELERIYNEKLKNESELNSKKETVSSEINYSTKVIGSDDVEKIVKENTALTEYVEEKWYKKIFDKIKLILGKK